MLCIWLRYTSIWCTECIVQLHILRVADGCSAKTQIFLLPIAMPWGLAEALSQCSPVSAWGKSHNFLSSHSLPGALTAYMLLDLNVPKLAASLVKALVYCVAIRHYFFSGMLVNVTYILCSEAPVCYWTCIFHYWLVRASGSSVFI